MLDVTFRTFAFSTSVIVIFATGIVLTRSGYPFGTISLTVHKLLSLAVVVSVGVIGFRSLPLSSSNNVLFLSAMVLCLTTFITGGLISAFELIPTSVAWFHRIGSWIAGLTLISCKIRLV